MTVERMELAGADRVKYFVPTAICGYLATICLVLIVLSPFLTRLRDTAAVTAAGVFGLLLTGGLGLVFWRAQRRDLIYTHLATTADASFNHAMVRQAALQAGWRIVHDEVPRRLAATVHLSSLEAGEWIDVQFRGSDVLVASICDPSIGFSLVGRRHCAQHRELVRRVVSGAAFGEAQAD